MNTLRFWNLTAGGVVDRRLGSRHRVNLYGVEICDGVRYLRKIRDLSRQGMMMEDRLVFQQPGAILELELPRRQQQPLRVRAEVVRVNNQGEVGLRTIGAPSLAEVGGSIDL
jgi:PilZ domain